MKPTPRRSATAIPNMKPRDSMPATRATFVFVNGSARASQTSRQALGEARSGEMSLNMIPGFGKSGTSRTDSRIVASTLLIERLSTYIPGPLYGPRGEHVRRHAIGGQPHQGGVPPPAAGPHER